MEQNSPGSPSRRVIEATPLLRSAPGEAQCPISFLLRYGDVWSDWRTKHWAAAGKEETLELKTKENIVAISGYSGYNYGSTVSLQVESSAGRSWGPFGDHEPSNVRKLRSSPSSPNGLRLKHISGDHTKKKYILRWLHQFNQMKTWMVVSILFNEQCRFYIDELHDQWVFAFCCVMPSIPPIIAQEKSGG